MEDWPAAAPAPSGLRPYVRDDLVELWRGWATNRSGDLDVLVSGTQQFSLSSSRNSADITIATNAIADFGFRSEAWMLSRRHRSLTAISRRNPTSTILIFPSGCTCSE